jgi:hypothetical protein
VVGETGGPVVLVPAPAAMSGPTGTVAIVIAIATVTVGPIADRTGGRTAVQHALAATTGPTGTGAATITGMMIGTTIGTTGT